MITRKTFFLGLIFLFCFSATQAQIKSTDWNLNQTKRLTKQASLFAKYPHNYIVADIPLEKFDQQLKSKEQEIELPAPDGSFTSYIISPSKVVADEVAQFIHD